ncbi:MAG: PAS domain S-box protein, partial [bacterium]|nr:PAS domain S-box protein [bacterium]
SSSGRYTHLDGELHRRVPFDCYKIGRIASGEIPKFLTNDITSDQMLHNRKWAKELGLVSFAGYQLLSSGGIPAGVLAIFKKTTISPEDDLYLQNIANTTAQVIQQMETERALQESEEKYRTLTENLNAGIYRSTPDSKGRFLAASHAVVKMFGFESIEEFLSINVSDVYNNPGERPGFIQKVSEKGLVKDHEIEFKRKDGTVFIGSDTSVAVKNKQGTLLYLDGIIEDITERKRTESVQKVLYNILNAALKTDTLNTLLEIVHSEINTLMDAKNFYVALYNEKTGMYTFPYFADEFDEFDAYETVKLGKGFTEFVRKNNKSLLIDKVSGKELIKAGEVSLMGKRAESWMGVPLKSYEESIGVVAVQSYKKPDVYTEQDLKILTYVSGHIAMAIERKQAEEALVRTRFSIEQSIDPIYWIDSKGNILDINNAACTNLGYSKEELLSMRVFDLGSEFPPEIWKEHFEVLKKKKNLLFEATHIRKNGIELPVEINSTYVKFDEQELVCSFARNITERKQSEEEKKKLLEQLFHAQKMESIGRLAGGIAHDFNNILVGIKGFAELLKLKFDDRSTSEGKAADVIMKGSERAADLTKQLLGFARGGKYNPVPLNLNDVIRNNVKVSEKIFEKNIKVKYDFAENINNVEADKNQIDQVLTNLIINAKDAMPKGGDLIFKTENIYADEKFKRQNPYFNLGHYVKISITDTGTGMSKRVKENIFDPFFTTKGEGKGTGLGLATVYGIVKNHDGQISVYSEPDKGTTFILYFPVSEKKILEAPEVMEIIKGEATILVVDDEEHVRELSVDMLKELGYKTLLAKDGKEAVSIFKKRKDEIDLVLLDMIMPEMAGRETNLRLKSINPDVRVLLMSGYSQNGTAAEILDEGVLGFIQKPFGMGELSAAIAKVLKTLK